MDEFGGATAFAAEDVAWQRLSALEHLMADNRDSRQLVVITAVFGFDHGLPDGWVTRVFAPRLAAHPRFRARLLTGARPRFALVPGFDPSNHVHKELPADADATPEARAAAFAARVSALTSQPLDWNAPLWTVHYFPGFAPGAPANIYAAAIVVRVHHVLGDGIALIKYCLRDVVDPECSASIPVRRREIARPSAWRRVLPFLRDAAFVFCGTLVPDSPSLYNTAPLGRNKFALFLPPKSISLARVKEAAKFLSVTVNDIFVTALTGALHAYLDIYGDGHYPRRFHAALAFNMHALDTESCELNNQVVLIPMRLDVSESDISARLRTVTNETNSIKASYLPYLTVAAFRIVQALPRVLRMRVWCRLTRRISAVWTNLPGPSQKVTIGGVAVDSVSIAAPADGHCGVVFSMLRYALTTTHLGGQRHLSSQVGIVHCAPMQLMIHVFLTNVSISTAMYLSSYAGNCSFCFSGDPRRVRHPDVLAKLFMEELKELITVGSSLKA